MSDEISGEWLSAKENPPRHQVNKEKKKQVACKTRSTTIFKKDHPPTVHLSFSNTPPTPATLLALQRKKQSKLDLFFKPTQQKKENDQKLPKYRPIKRLRKSNNQCHDSNHKIFVQEAATNMEEKSSLKDCEVVGENTFDNENINLGDKFEISGHQVVDEENFSNENSSSAEDDFEFSPIIHVNSQVKCRTSPPCKRRKISPDSAVGVNFNTGNEVSQCLNPDMEDDKRVLCDTTVRKCRAPEIKKDTYHEPCFLPGSMSDIFTSQELSEIPPFTFNQVTKVPIDKSSHNEVRLKTLAGVDSESVGFTQWVQRQGEKCKRIQSEIQSFESRGLLIDNSPCGNARRISGT